ncbi:MAG: hypothetical protein H6673_10995 [Anaerolineales bacterium]|nr:hypothetical protein [Anaerolineales bacterium]
MWSTAVLIGMAFGAVIGLYLRQQSLKEKKLYGGLFAEIFHYLACAMLGSMTPFIITAIVSGMRFLTMFGTAVGFLALGAVMVAVYGVFESQAPEPQMLRPELD